MSSEQFRRLKKASRIAIWLTAILLIATIGVVKGDLDGWPLLAASTTASILAVAAYLVVVALAQAQAQHELTQALTGDARRQVPIVLFLRSFDVAKAGLVGRAISALGFLLQVASAADGGAADSGPGRYDPEEELADAVGAMGMLVAIGDKRASYGSAKVVVRDEDWKQTFRMLSDAAGLIFMMPGPSASVLWELGQILESRSARAKTIFIMPREGFRYNVGHELKSIFTLSRHVSVNAKAWSEVAEMIAHKLQFKLPRYDSEGCYFRQSRAGQSCETVALEALTRAIAKYAASQARAGDLTFDVGEIWKLATDRPERLAAASKAL